MTEKQKAIARMIERLDPFDLVLRGNKIRCTITNQSGGVYSPIPTTAGLAKNETLYILAAGNVDLREYDTFTHRGKNYQIGTPSQTIMGGEVVQTQCPITQVGA